MSGILRALGLKKPKTPKAPPGIPEDKIKVPMVDEDAIARAKQSASRRLLAGRGREGTMLSGDRLGGGL